MLAFLAPGWSVYAQTTLTPAALSFGYQILNVSSAAKTATLTNTEAAPLTISSIAFTGGNALGDYAWGGNCPLRPSTLGPGNSCLITVTFTPSALGTRTATLTVTDDAPSSPQTATLSGRGVLPATLANASVSFGNVGENSPSAPQSLRLYNAQPVPLTISGIRLSNSDYTETDTCHGSVAARSFCTISVTLTPSVLGADNGTLSVTDSASNSPQTATLTGAGILPATLGLMSLSFGNVPQSTASAARNITLYNEEAVALTILGITVSNPDFTETNTCHGSVAANGACIITITFTPGIVGAETGTLTVTDAASNSPQTASLTGTGVGAVAGLSPTRLTFASQAVGTTSAAQTITLNNTGNLPLSLSSLAPTGANAGDFAQTTTCGAGLAVKSGCKITILFTPSAAGVRTASLSIADNASGSPQSVSLSGTGTHDVIVTWTASATSGVVGYNVYRGTTSGGETATPMNSAPIDGTTYVDENVKAGVTYYYVVTAIASNGVTQSADSSETSATVP